MSENNAIQLDQLPLNDELVSAYLQDNPDFFLRQPHLLTSLRLHDSQRGVVSLVERQQQALRQKNHLLEEEITQLLTVASHNEQLFTLYSDLYLRLLDCHSAEELLDCLHQATTELLSLSDCKLWLSQDTTIRHRTLVTADCQGIFNNRLSKDTFYFGRLQQSEQQRIFDGISAGSVVLIKLHYADQDLGFIAISSVDDEHFDPRMDTLLLNQFSKLVAKLLQQHLNNAAVASERTE